MMKSYRLIAKDYTKLFVVKVEPYDGDYINECNKCIFYTESPESKSNVEFGCKIRYMNSYGENLCQFLSRKEVKIDYNRDDEYFYMDDVSLYDIIRYEECEERIYKNKYNS